MGREREEDNREEGKEREWNKGGRGIGKVRGVIKAQSLYKMVPG